MRHTSLTIELSPDERQMLTRMVRERRQPAYLRDRARMVLLCAEHVPITTIGERVGISTPHVYRWLYAWQTAGIRGLQGTNREAVRCRKEAP